MDESEGGDSRAGAQTAAALGMAMNEAARDPSLSEDAREYLNKQSRLTDLQIENLRKVDEYETSHLRWRRFNDQMKGALQIMLVLVGAVVVIGLMVAIWNASQADGIVVDSFSVPPQFAATGVAGDVVADDLTNRIALVRDTANKFTFTSTKNVRKDRDEAIKVDIPDTGISLTQAWRALRGWLGHERHLSGNLRMVGRQKIALTVALEGENAMTFTGDAGDLANLEQQAAEQVYAKVDPGNYVLYLHGTGHPVEALAAAARLVQVTTDGDHAYSLWANETRHNGDAALSLKRALIGISLSPKLAVGHMEAMFDDEALGYNAAALEQANAILKLNVSDQPPSQQEEAFPAIIAWAFLERDTEAGDFGKALADGCPFCTFAQALLSRAEFAARMHNVGGSRRLIAEALAAGPAPAAEISRARYFSDVAAADWRRADVDARAWALASGKSGKGAGVAAGQHVEIAPWLAAAQAHTENIADAHATIDGTPFDCYECLRARGQVSALERNWLSAEVWFKRAVVAAPDVPGAYFDWGEMLLRKGDVDGAIAKFEQAHEKGPHFADPLEMWGEALIQKNRSDLALAKFEEADKYAPNWGRLHLKWGKALWWSGDKSGAQKQFAIASGLALTTTEKSELTKVAHG